ncbi:hypothetical protein KQ940_15435 [Marinobacterium sp. D7]|uniref:hypothetical protein n=1 Tax=Marinobacterium ramblicola TaxID=2849041 RepID=UPI001C2D76A6|nr:hypothetical protein [Marinobacterium ramblicola]MBV1789447.1 hypothetical protein [Marinobacterium ramblicola]
MKQPRLFLPSILCLRAKLLMFVLLAPLLLSACSSQSMIGRTFISDSYATGFHDGRHSGLKKGGNASESIIKDLTRFAEDEEYRSGWLAGEQEGMRIEKELRASKGVVSSNKPKKEVEKPPRDNKTVDPELIQDMQTSKLKF